MPLDPAYPLQQNWSGRPRAQAVMHYAQPTARVELAPHNSSRGYSRAPPAPTPSDGSVASDALVVRPEATMAETYGREEHRSPRQPQLESAQDRLGSERLGADSDLAGRLGSDWPGLGTNRLGSGRLTQIWPS